MTRVVGLKMVDEFGYGIGGAFDPISCYLALPVFRRSELPVKPTRRRRRQWTKIGGRGRIAAQLQCIAADERAPSSQRRENHKKNQGEQKPGQTGEHGVQNPVKRPLNRREVRRADPSQENEAAGRAGGDGRQHPADPPP